MKNYALSGAMNFGVEQLSENMACIVKGNGFPGKSIIEHKLWNGGPQHEN